jgi:signal peptidase I
MNPVPETTNGGSSSLADSSTDSQAAPQPEQQRPVKPAFSGWVRDIFISLAVSAFFIIFLYQPVKVEGTSMMPTLEDQERVFINKFVYKLEPIERGDVIVFRYPRDPSKSYIKRVVAVAGDHVLISAGVVLVNGHRLTEDYVPRMYEDVRSYPEIVVPPHSYFVLGDHRNLSNDSRDFGPVDEDFIYGKAVFGYWPMDKLGTLR